MGKSTNEELDKRDINVKLSFNEIKCILFNFRNYQVSSKEGQISIAVYDSLKNHLERKAKQGKLPPEIAKHILNDAGDDS